MVPPTIALAGAHLRPLRPEDAVPWHGYLSDPEVIEWTSYPVMSLEDVRSMVDRCLQGYTGDASCTWAVARAEDDALLGTCGFNRLVAGHGCAELAYDLARRYWGKGLISRAVTGCLGWAFEQREFNRVEAFVMVGNARSERVLEKAQFTREGHLRSFRMCRGEPRDYSVFSVLRGEWERSERGRRTRR